MHTLVASDGSAVRLNIRLRNKCGVFGGNKSGSGLRINTISVIFE
jgi:hypothetical protein